MINATQSESSKLIILRPNNTTTPKEHGSQLPEGLLFPFELVSDHLAKVDKSIREQARSFDPGVEGYVSYACDISGKKIRPALAILAGGSTGKITKKSPKNWLLLSNWCT